jgi:hypothetical protein
MLRDAARERYRIDVAEHRLEVQPDGSTIEGSKHSGTPEQCEECQTGIRLLETVEKIIAEEKSSGPMLRQEQTFTYIVAIAVFVGVLLSLVVHFTGRA